MALPSVTVTISEETFRPSSGEVSGTFIAGAVVAGMTLINALGTTAEVSQQYIQFTSLADLNSRLSLNSGNSAGYTFEGFSGGEGALYPSSGTEVRWPNGPTGDWRTAFHTIEAAAQYGAQVIVGVSSADPFTSSAQEMNCIFDGDGSSDSELATILSNRNNDLLVVHSTTNKAANPSEDSKYHVYVYGKKQYIPDASTLEKETELGGPLEIPLSADVVGCMARSFRTTNQWASPAGFSRGKILNVYRLVNPLSASEANTLYTNNVNPILSFANQGIVLFGDKSTNGDKIGLTNLLLYLQNEIGAITREALFELNNASTRTSVTNRVNSLLQSVKNQFGIERYTVTCDETNNPPEIANAGNFVLKVEYKPINSVDTIVLEFVPESADTTGA